MDNNQFWAFLLMAFLVGGLFGYGMGGLQKVVGESAAAEGKDNEFGRCVATCVTSGEEAKTCLQYCQEEPVLLVDGKTAMQCYKDNCINPEDSTKDPCKDDPKGATCENCVSSCLSKGSIGA